MKAQDIKTTLENKAQEFGISNADVADNFDMGIINIHNGNNVDSLTEQIVSLFKNDLGIDASADEIIEGATLYAKEYSKQSHNINA